MQTQNDVGFFRGPADAMCELADRGCRQMLKVGWGALPQEKPYISEDTRKAIVQRYLELRRSSEDVDLRQIATTFGVSYHTVTRYTAPHRTIIRKPRR